MSNSRYPDDWNQIANFVKNQVDWKCQKCGMQCLKPQDDVEELTISERRKRTLTVHHSNYKPEDNRLENLIPLCTGCHLSYHSGKKGNISIGQMSLFQDFEGLILIK